MSKQNINLGAAPTGQGGDTPRSANVKIGANFDEIYAQLGGNTLPAALPVEKGGTAATTPSAARANLGLGSSATLSAGTGTGNLMPLQAGSWHAPVELGLPYVNNLYNMNERSLEAGFYGPVGGNMAPGASSYYGIALALKASSNEIRSILQFSTEGDIYYLSIVNPSQGGAWRTSKIYTTQNTTRAADGTLKAI